MAAIQDPNFWHRFSVAVHNDDAEKQDLKHSYVISLDIPSTLASPTTPSSQRPLTLESQPPPLSPMSHDAFPLSPLEPLSPPTSPSSSIPRTPSGRRLKKSPSQHKTKINAKSPKSPRRPSLAHIHAPFTRHGNASNLTIGLSGRPPSRFKFWTNITADPSNRDSWLEGQRRKRRQRTWICWCFWIGFFVLVGGIVAAILVLRSKGII
jgi:hypothetical protein